MFLYEITPLPLQLLQELRQVSLTFPWVDTPHTPKVSQVQSHNPNKSEHVKPGTSHVDGT